MGAAFVLGVYAATAAAAKNRLPAAVLRVLEKADSMDLIWIDPDLFGERLRSRSGDGSATLFHSVWSSQG